jgi:hypothetical protein
VACRTACAPCLSPPAFISTARQRLYLLVFVRVELSVCEHRGACRTSTTVFWVGWFFIVYFFNPKSRNPNMCVSGLSHRVCPMPAFPRHHIDSAVVCVSVCICRGGVECVWAQGRMAHAARQQPYFWWAVDAFLCYVGEGLVEPRVTHARPLLSSYRQRSSVSIDLYLWW